jgi:DNA-binding transcriptional LysR family regulator
MDALAIDDLRLFLRVAARGTLSAVARERDVPVSQVSRTLSRIEKACGARLIHRSTHGLSLTAEGETFLEYCRRIAGTFEELEGEFADRTREPSGLVRVSASTVIAQYLLVPSLAELHERHPALRIDISVSDQLVDMARDGIDIAVRTATTLADTVIARRLGELGRALYAAPDYVKRHGLPAQPGDLQQHRLVTNTAAPHLNHWPFVADGQRFALSVDGHWRTNDTGLAANIVLQGLAIGRLATVVAAPLVRAGWLVPVLPEWVDLQPSPVYAIVASNRQRLPKIKTCLDYWGEWFAREQALGPVPMATRPR